MKGKKIVFFVGIALAAILAGCGKKEEPEVVVTEVTKEKEVAEEEPAVVIEEPEVVVQEPVFDEEAVREKALTFSALVLKEMREGVEGNAIGAMSDLYVGSSRRLRSDIIQLRKGIPQDEIQTDYSGYALETDYANNKIKEAYQESLDEINREFPLEMEWTVNEYLRMLMAQGYYLGLLDTADDIFSDDHDVYDAWRIFYTMRDIEQEFEVKECTLIGNDRSMESYAKLLDIIDTEFREKKIDASVEYAYHVVCELKKPDDPEGDMLMEEVRGEKPVKEDNAIVVSMDILSTDKGMLISGFEVNLAKAWQQYYYSENYIDCYKHENVYKDGFEKGESKDEFICVYERLLPIEEKILDGKADELVYAIYTVLNLNEVDNEEAASLNVGNGKLSIDLGTFGEVIDSATGGSAGVAAFFLKKEFNDHLGNYLKWGWDDLTHEVGMAWNDFKQEALSWW